MLPEETLDFIVAAFLSSSEGDVKNPSTTGEEGRRELRAGVGIQSKPFRKCGKGFELSEKVFDLVRTCEGWR